MLEDLLPLLRAAPKPQGSENPRPSSQTLASTPPLAPTPPANAGTPTQLANGHAHAEARAPQSPFQAPEAVHANGEDAAARVADQPAQAALGQPAARAEPLASRESPGLGVGVKPGSGLGSWPAGAPRSERLLALHALLAAGGDARLRHLAFVALMRLGGAPPTLYRDRAEDELAGGGGARTEVLRLAGAQSTCHGWSVCLSQCVGKARRLL